MGLPQIVPNQSLYYNQEYPLNNDSPQVGVIRSALGVYPENSNFSQANIIVQPSNTSGEMTEPDARVLLASPIPITAAGFPQNHHKIKKFSRETNYESDFSIIETEGAFPQQPSSGETMDYKYKRSQQQQQQQPYQTSNGMLTLPQVFNNNFQQQQQNQGVPVLSNIVNGQQQPQYTQMIQIPKQQQMAPYINDQNNQFPQQLQQQQRIINHQNNNSRAQRAAQLTNPTTQLGTVAELYTDTNYSGDTNNEGNSQKDTSIRKSNSFQEPQQPLNSSQNDKEGGGKSPLANQNAKHRKQVSAMNEILGELQVGPQNGESPPNSSGVKKSLSLAKKQALKKALDNTGKQYQLLPLISKPMIIQQAVDNNRASNAEESKKPNSSKRQKETNRPSLSPSVNNKKASPNSSTLIDNYTSDRNSPAKPLKSERPQPSNRTQAVAANEEIKESGLIDDYLETSKVEDIKKENTAAGGERLSMPGQKELIKSNRSVKVATSQENRETYAVDDQSPQSPDALQTDNNPEIIEPLQEPEETPQDKEINDLVMLMAAHQTLKQELLAAAAAKSAAQKSGGGAAKSRRHGQNFRKRKQDMVFRQLTYVHESCLIEELKTFKDDIEVKRDPQNFSGANNGKIMHQQSLEVGSLDKLGLASVQLLRMIPRIVSDNKIEQKNVSKVFVQTQGNTRVKMIGVNGERDSYKCFMKRSLSFPKKEKDSDKKLYYCEQTNSIIQKKVKELIEHHLIESTIADEQDFSHLKRSNSYDHSLKLGKDLPKLKLQAPTSRKLDEIFPNCHHHENNTNKQSNFDESSRVNGLSSNRGGGIGHADHHQHNNNQHSQQHHPDANQINRYDEGLSSLQSSMEEDHDNNKSGGGNKPNFGNAHQRGSLLLTTMSRPRQNPLRRLTSMSINKNQPATGNLGQQQTFNNSIFTLGDYKGNLGGNIEMLYPSGPTNGRIISKEKVDEIEELLSQALKALNITPKQLAIQSSLVNAIKDQFVISVQDEDVQYHIKNNRLESIIVEKFSDPVIVSVKSESIPQSIILKSTKLQRTIENVKPTLRIHLTPEVEKEMLHDITNEDRILRYQKFFLMPRESGVQIPAVLTGVTPIQKIVDLKTSFIQNSNRKIGTQSQTINAPTDFNLNELHQAELKVIFDGRNHRYDVLSDTRIFEPSFYFLGVSVADPRKSQFSQNQKPLIIKLRGTIQEADVDAVEDSSEHSTVIINFLRERYLCNFTKYQKHLTQRERPTSRYYNSHQAKELAMLSMTGGFSREHRALPQWKVHNNQELLHFQVAQLRRAYSLWLNRVSMNECIKRTLFQSKNDLLLNNVRSSNNINLISPQLIELTIDKICQLCYKPEDTYKLNIILGKSTQQQHGAGGGQTTMATTGAKTQGNSVILNQTRTDESLYESVKTSTAQGLDETQADYNDKNESATAIYLHNHPAFITYNQDLEVADNLSIDSFIPMRFRMSTLFGYKTKIVRDGLYEVFEPVADARYLLAIAFKRAFMIKREQRGKHQVVVPGVITAGATNPSASNVSSLLEAGQQSNRNRKEGAPKKTYN